jgi:hypothetical protein
VERPLLDALMSRFEGHETEIEQAIAEAEARAAADIEPEPEDVDAACDGIEGCEAPETIEEEELAEAD